MVFLEIFLNYLIPHFLRPASMKNKVLHLIIFSLNNFHHPFLEPNPLLVTMHYITLHYTYVSPSSTVILSSIPSFRKGDTGYFC